MRLGRKVDDGRRPVSLQQACDKLGIADVAVNEGMAGVVGDTREIFEIARISELVETDDRGQVVGKPGENEIGADEAGRPGHQDRLFFRTIWRAVARSDRTHLKSF